MVFFFSSRRRHTRCALVWSSDVFSSDLKILIQAVIDIDPETRGEALAGARGWIEGALEQSGCLAYAWTLDPHVATRIHVFEEWDGEARSDERSVGTEWGSTSSSWWAPYQ